MSWTVLCQCIQITNSDMMSSTYYFFRNGLAPNGSRYGPLTDLPDWSYAGKISQMKLDEAALSYLYNVVYLFAVR